jgi:hypothetical protein
MAKMVDVYDGQGRQIAQLSDERLTAVPAAARLHPSKNWLCGVTGSGRLCLWTA